MVYAGRAERAVKDRAVCRKDTGVCLSVEQGVGGCPTAASCGSLFSEGDSAVFSDFQKDSPVICDLLACGDLVCGEYVHNGELCVPE